MWRRRAARKGVEAGELVDSEVVSGGRRPTALGAHMWGYVGHLMGLLSVVHHLLISPLCKLGIGRIVIGGLDLVWRRVRTTVERVGLLMRILVESGVELLLLSGIPTSLLLLDRIRIRLLLRDG